jgi:hypothetical protein
MCIENNVHQALQGLSGHLQKADDEVLFHVSPLGFVLRSPFRIQQMNSSQDIGVTVSRGGREDKCQALPRSQVNYTTTLILIYVVLPPKETNPRENNTEGQCLTGTPPPLVPSPVTYHFGL